MAKICRLLKKNATIRPTIQQSELVRFRIFGGRTAEHGVHAARFYVMMMMMMICYQQRRRDDIVLHTSKHESNLLDITDRHYDFNNMLYSTAAI